MLRFTVVRDKNVLRLDVPVQDSLAVNRSDSVQNLVEHVLRKSD